MTGGTAVDVVTVGECMVLLTPPAGVRIVDAEALEIHTAGAEANVAVQLAQFGIRAAWIGRVGSDPLGELVVATLRGFDVNVSAVEVDEERPTGVYFKEYDGHRTQVHYYRKGSAATRLTLDDVRPMLSRTRVLHISGITAALSTRCRQLVDDLLRTANQQGVVTSFDVNFRPALWSPERAGPVLAELARSADLVFVGRDEAETVWGVGSDPNLRSLLGPRSTIVVKDGSHGAVALTPGEGVFVPAPRVSVVEPVGAGDAFAAGYLWGLARDESQVSRLRRGHLAAAVVLSSVADFSPHPPSAWFDQLVALPDDEWAALSLDDPSSLGAVPP